MKEVEPKLNADIEMSVKQKKEIKASLIGDITLHEGHTLFEINTETLEVTAAKFSNVTYQMFGQNKKQVIVKEGCAYVAALNKSNALKKYKAGKTGGKELDKDPLYFPTKMY